jgi:hypothetical protein
MLWLLLLLPLLTGGCTGLLWHYTDWTDRPAINPNLRLFQAGRQKDLLVVYDEYAERSKTVQPRAYLLYKNQERVAQSQCPHFVGIRMAQGLPAVPVFQDSMPLETNSLPGLYAVVSTNTESFLVCSNHQTVSSHNLPMYTDPAGVAERNALMPFAVTVDVSLVAGAIYCWLISPKTDTWPNQ